ncbi:hypothetical protein D0863_14517 [Hortaea werneckii]|uniref:Amino acid transporter transmembrane domain-containing protein n=1 Tax=Hortaea werneckii TaxID=91943 RepID=A0A3M7CJ40_HORWE|nr:hypothetical protein D0863_14517 [Hortaea werneckii]
MLDQPQENSERGGNPSRSPIVRERDCDSTAIPCSPTSTQAPGEKKTAGDDILAVVPTNPSHIGSSHGDIESGIESGTEHKEEPDNLSPRNASHADGTVIETPPQDEVHYATMSWWHTALGKQTHSHLRPSLPPSLSPGGKPPIRIPAHPPTQKNRTSVMIAETVSLGILSLPSALATLGYIPGILLILTLGLLSWYTGHIIYQLKMQHFHSIHSYADIFDILWPGGPGRWFGEVATGLMLVFIVAAHIVTFSVMMNVLTNGGGGGGGMCSTNVFMAVGTVVCLGVSLPRTFRANRWASMGSCLSILLATFTALTSIALTTPHPLPPSYPLPPAHLPQTTLPQRTLSLSSLILAYNGQIAYPTLLTEMHTPQKDFPKSLRFLILTTTTLYILTATLIYHYAGTSVSSPALGSAPPLGRKLAYGFAIPTIVVAGVIPGLVARMYGSLKAIIENGSDRRPFSCASNA